MTSDLSQTAKTDPLFSPPAEQQPVDEIIYRISHDLRGSTRALSELPSWIKEDLEDAGLELPEKVQQCMYLMQDHAQRLNNMIDGLLKHSRVGRTPATTLEADHAVKKALMRSKIPDSVRLRFRLQPAALKISMADLEMAVDVLIQNALVHAAPCSRIAITGSIHNPADSAMADPLWILKVRDVGPGIAERHWSEVFKPMVFLHAASEQKGVGMGLAILDKIAQHYGGEAWIDQPKHGRQGATVCFALPVMNES